MKLMCNFDIEKNSESENQLEIQNEIEKLINLINPCIDVPFGFVIASI
jgi:hypothetical protein